jgi:uncharacterized protein GlcG (DUF336 family)
MNAAAGDPAMAFRRWGILSVLLTVAIGGLSVDEIFGGTGVGDSPTGAEDESCAKPGVDKVKS